MEFAPILLATLFYVVAGRWIITRVSVESPLRVVAFLGLNLAIIAYLHCWLPRSLDITGVLTNLNHAPRHLPGETDHLPPLTIPQRVEE